MEVGATLLTGALVGLLGWLAGALANAAADLLPAVGREPGQVRAPAPAGQFAIWHYATLPWFFFRGGVCPHCRARRPPRAPLLELATVAAFLIGWWMGRDAPEGVVRYWCCAAFFLTVLVIDLEHRRVLNIMVGPAAGIALLAAALHGIPSLLSALLGGAIGLGLFLLVALIGRGKMGMGDVKLAGLIGLVTGYPDVLSALFIGILLGGLGGIALLITRRAGLKSFMAYAPYLSIGVLIVLLRSLS